MSIGILGGTGPAGRGLATRLAAVGEAVVIGSREAARADKVAASITERWPDRGLRLSGADNATAAAADLVVLATPWDAALPTIRAVAAGLDGKVVVSMVVGMVRDGREFLAMVPPRGSMAAAVQQAVPSGAVSAALHHVPASGLEDLAETLAADVLVCADEPRALDATVSLIERIEGLRPVEVGSLAQAGPVESFTAVLTTVNLRHKVHASMRLTGYEGRHR